MAGVAYHRWGHWASDDAGRVRGRHGEASACRVWLEVRSYGRDRRGGVDVRRALDADTLDPYGVVVLGSAVYLARWRRDALRLLRRPELAERDVWLFSSGPVGKDPEGGPSESWTKPQRVTRRAAEVNAREHVVFGGRVSEDAGGFMRKSMAKNSPPELRDRRDWDEIRAWAEKIAAASG